MMNQQSNEPLSLQWYRAAERWVDAEAAASLLEDTRGAIFGQMTMRQEGSSVAAKELKTKASPEWLVHAERIAAARKHANKLKIECDYIKMKYYEAAGQSANERVMARL